MGGRVGHPRPFVGEEGKTVIDEPIEGGNGDEEPGEGNHPEDGERAELRKMEERENEEVDPVGIAGEERGGGDGEPEGADGVLPREEPGEGEQEAVANRFLHEIANGAVEGLQGKAEDGERGEREGERAGAEDAAPVEAEGAEGQQEVGDADEFYAGSGE